MILVAAATELEMRPVRRQLPLRSPVELLVTGVGLLAAAVAMTKRLAIGDGIEGVVLFGVGGAYPESGAGLLDLCLASQEIWADYGVRHDDRTAPFTAPELAADHTYSLDRDLLAWAERAFAQRDLPVKIGRFVTVAGATGTQKRGGELWRDHHGMCENMEGAAVVRVCREFAVPCLEIRCISNLVEDLDRSRWRLNEAVIRGGEAVCRLLDGCPEVLSGTRVGICDR